MKWNNYIIFCMQNQNRLPKFGDMLVRFKSQIIVIHRPGYKHVKPRQISKKLYEKNDIEITLIHHKHLNLP